MRRRASAPKRVRRALARDGDHAPLECPPCGGGLTCERRRSNWARRSLQRRLFEAGTTFEELREQVREDLAVKYVQQSSLRLLEISEILGYSQQSAFSRAFKRLRGVTPRQLRAMPHEAEPGRTAESVSAP